MYSKNGGNPQQSLIRYKQADLVLLAIERDHNYCIHNCPANTLHKSNVILRSYFGNLLKLLSANVDVT